MSSEEELIHVPDMSLSRQYFLATSGPEEQRTTAQNALFKGIDENNMAPFYKFVCTEQGWSRDDALLARMEQSNQEELEKLDARLKDAEENLGESEVSDALRVRAEHFARIGDKSRI
ncbi:hypothetical protein BJ684DRAFT_19181 [Piptocephalis cylindrospora]|uniref:26S proteasome regulatory subunit Rpn7 N-terminal domain-containing protein n=1 Tax=Piptocephalis cylindrospora TaxID=1907219 RepID=A0A4P9Y6J4_9FUNG|nr:hypothetical protein BJ684DRAFT_19181 [Piptocephalis cylindrospora]|eukprot:RKP14402.1 hypothetical protein BJ684DRAFT_19181 [Piptocephalis cylindrospora]